MLFGFIQRRLGLISKTLSVEAVAAAEGVEERNGVALWAISLGERLENSVQAHSEQSVGFELLLVAEQMELHQQLIAHPSVERGDDVRKLLMKCAFAVSDGLTVAQVLFRND
jgi:hypothetical protein